MLVLIGGVVVGAVVVGSVVVGGRMVVVGAGATGSVVVGASDVVGVVTPVDVVGDVGVCVVPPLPGSGRRESREPVRAGSRRTGPRRPAQSDCDTTAAGAWARARRRRSRCSRSNRSALRWGRLEVRSPSRAPILVLDSGSWPRRFGRPRSKRSPAAGAASGSGGDVAAAQMGRGRKCSVAALPRGSARVSRVAASRCLSRA